jgi:acetylornithine/N-succinyldiaminopimelate aminotransferase
VSTQDDLIKSGKQHLMQNYRQQPVVLVRGQGARVWDADGREYLDMTAGIAVCALGHGHPGLAAAIGEQAGTLIQVSNLFYGERQIALAERLTARSFADRAFFCNSGAEANEAALKCARRWQAVVAGKPEKTAFIATHASFHGRSIGTVSITGQDKYRKGFGPLFGPVRFVDYGDLQAMQEALAPGDVCAVILEPIQAEGGIIVPPAGYLAGVREATRAAGALLIFDEVQTGVGRTGKLWGHEHDGVTPDLMTLAKGLAGGVPIGALLATDAAARGLLPADGEPVTHASTFGGNALASAAALYVLDTIEREGLLAHVTRAGEHLRAGLGRLCERHPGVAVEPRGRGLLAGLALASDPAGAVARARALGALFSVAGSTTLRLVPPLNVTIAELDRALAIIDQVLAERSKP